jgi:branched-chain amino acid transport system ATP-binding protein
MVAIRGVDAAYGRVQALHAVDMDVPEGTIVAILGPNGAGKSTLLKCVSAILRPTRGSITVDGTEITGRDPAFIVRRGIVHCPEGRHVFPDFTVEENLRAGAYARGSMHGIERAFALFPVLQQRRSQRAGTLSGGEQQMLAIGRALMAEPRVLLLDEPSLGLSPLLTERIFESIAQLRETGVTIALVEQNAAAALALADTAVVLVQGRVRFAGSARDAMLPDLLHAAYLGTT